ncbi:MAG TPA: SIMPL domain-containing protein [Solirubrobacteraceae bacterium]|nr:SIMPL domain-containing protein [Solirubrobacteraceae bacterium]
MPATVKVRGEGLIRTEPDEALLWIALTALESAPGAALQDVSTRAAGLVAMLDDLGVAKADRATTGVTVHEEFEHGSEGRRSLGHRAITRVSVRLTDHELIGRLIERSVQELGARIDGPRWQIAPDNPARLEAARAAAADAQRKARAYAEGLGAGLGPPLDVVEADEHSAGHASGAWRAAARSLSIGEPVAVEPGEQEVAASVYVTFALDYTPSSAGV